MVVRCCMVAFSLWSIYVTLFSTALPEIRLSLFLAFILIMGFLNFPMRKDHVKPNSMPWYDILAMVIGTSAIVDTEIDGAVGMNSGIFNNPFIIWGRYKKKLFRYCLPISFQFHHTQMDGAHAGKFLAELQSEINSLR